MNGTKASYGIAGVEHHHTSKNDNVEKLRHTPNGASLRAPLSDVNNNKTTSREVSDSSLAPNRVIDMLGRQNSTISKTGSEGDSVLDLYGRSASTSKVSINTPDRQSIPDNMYRFDDDPEGWIHRDKLLRIESEELHAAGANIAGGLRTISRSARRGSLQISATGPVDTLEHNPQRTVHEEKRRRISPTMEEDDLADERETWDLRSPEEIATDEVALSTAVVYKPVVRKGGSRLPVFTSSPTPVPQEHMERDTPLQRKRTISGSRDRDELVQPKIRARAHSAGSQNLLDEVAAVNGTPTPAGSRPGSNKSNNQPSPTRAKPPTAKLPSTTSAITSSPATAPAPANSRKTTPSTRKRSSGEKTTKSPTTATTTTTTITTSPPSTLRGHGREPDRPRTAINRPEGDPPWLATMYKPDPMLPPDQQIVPTHAKRQMQEKWMEEGKIPRVYDRDFGALEVAQPLTPTPRARVVPTEPEVPETEVLEAPAKEKDNDLEPLSAWPSNKHSSVRSMNSTGSGRPGTSGSNATGGAATAGYSTMPRFREPGAGLAQSPLNTTVGTRMVMEPKVEGKPRDEYHADKEKAGCGCCVVM